MGRAAFVRFPEPVQKLHEMIFLHLVPCVVTVPLAEQGDLRGLRRQPRFDAAIEHFSRRLETVFTGEGDRFRGRLARPDDRLGADHLPLRHVFAVPDQDLSVGGHDHVE